MNHWIQNAIFYHIYPLGFCGAPLQNQEEVPVPRLDKLLDWIPHLKKLGVNALYLGPVCQSTKHGYDTMDYYRIDTRLGDNASFKQICAALHAAGIRVILDGVFNHVGRDFWAFRDVQEHGAASRYCGWFQNLNFGGGSPMGDPFWYESWGGHYELVKLNLRNPEVADHLLGAVRMWMDEFHIDGLRLDAADCVDLDFFRALRAATREKDPDFWLMGEIIHGDYSRWANAETLDSVTNYECYKGLWSCHNTRNYFEIAHSLNRQFGPGGIYRALYLYNFVDNHDVDRLASTLENKAHLPNVYTLLYTMPGAPSIYYGSEWAVEGRRSPTNDEMLRPRLDLAEMAGRDQSLCAHLARLAVIRDAFPALREGDYENVVIKNEQLVFRRAAGGQRVYVLLNLSGSEAAVEFPHQEPVLQDVLNGDALYHNDGGRSYVVLPPCSAKILVGAPDRFDWARHDAGGHGAPAEIAPPQAPTPSAEPAVSAPPAAGRLQGRVCVLTGPEDGVGGDIARSLADEGAAVVAASDGGAGWEPVIAQLRQRGAEVEFLPCPPADEGRAQWVMDEIARRFGRIDTLIALTGGTADLPSVEPGDYVGYLRTALPAPVLVGRYAVRHMPRGGSGCVVVVARGGGDAYRAALDGYLQTQSARCAPLGVRFNAVRFPQNSSGAGAALAETVLLLSGGAVTGSVLSLDA